MSAKKKMALYRVTIGCWEDQDNSASDNYDGATVLAHDVPGAIAKVRKSGFLRTANEYVSAVALLARED